MLKVMSLIIIVSLSIKRKGNNTLFVRFLIITFLYVISPDNEMEKVTDLIKRDRRRVSLEYLPRGVRMRLRLTEEETEQLPEEWLISSGTNV